MSWWNRKTEKEKQQKALEAVKQQLRGIKKEHPNTWKEIVDFVLLLEGGK